MNPRSWALTLVVIGCSRHHGLPAAFEGQRAILEAAIARKGPAKLHGKLSIKARSETLGIAGSTGGALFLDRPGRGHLAIMSPIGGPVVTAQTDGTGIAVAMMRDHRHLLAADAAAVLRRTLGDDLGIDEVLGLLEGELPFEEADIRSASLLPDGDLELRVEAAKGTVARVVIDDLTAAPVVVEVTKGEVLLLSLAYAPFAPMVEGGPWLPTEVAVVVPSLDLSLEWKARAWDAPTELPDVFGMATPEGFTTEALAGFFGPNGP